MTLTLQTPAARRRARAATPPAPTARPQAATGEHASWCVQHAASGCQGQVFQMPGTRLLVWLTAPSAGDPRLVVEGPDGLVELPVEA